MRSKILIKPSYLKFLASDHTASDSSFERDINLVTGAYFSSKALRRLKVMGTHIVLLDPKEARSILSFLVDHLEYDRLSLALRENLI